MTLAIRAGGVLGAWLVLVLVEVMVVGTIDRDLFAGNWEVVQARRLVSPIAFGALLPVALLASLSGELIVRAARDKRARFGVALVALLALGALAYGVSFGRHMNAPLVRLPFVGTFALVGAVLGWSLPPLVDEVSTWALGTTGALVAASAWVANVRILPHLYPAFHAALFLLLLAGAAWASAALRPRAPGWILLLAVSAACLGWAPFAAERLRLADNVRFVLTERTVVLGRAVEMAALIAPPPPLDDSDSLGGTSAAVVGEIPRSLDWTGRDLLLVSVDALRADHVSAYGYARPTTPNLDALAREGAVFDHAYCPTPHTSYSVTSMMTGKAMRPLMALGLGGGSETWAMQLRRYGYRTAAFYPPAVFYIDAERFAAFEESRLDFEYAKVQFSSAEDRVDEVARYLDTAPKSPVFVWVHLFEPHEPYIPHAGHLFSGPLGRPDQAEIDAYDSEVAYSDEAIGKLVALARARRPGITILVTADHGEEFGEHGGRYHGTTVYEEQVHVPLIVAGPGVRPGRVADVVQTIDLLPTVLSTLGVPRPARVRGRDLGPLLAGDRKMESGLAYAETDDFALVARGDERLVCARRVAACALYDVATDPAEKTDVASAHPDATRDLRRTLATMEHDVGRYEAGATPWPDPIRRGLMRDGDSAVDAASLLDDADVTIRRKAGEVMFILHPPAVAAETRRTLERDEDREVRSWCALALVRMGEAPSQTAVLLIHHGDVAWRRRAALAFASVGDARGATELAALWRDEAPPKGALDVEGSKEVVLALGRIRDVEAVPALIEALPFVPLRSFVADALGAIGDARALPPLFHLFEEEHYETARAHEARALLALGARRELLRPLTIFAGLPDPMVEAIGIARDAKLLEPGSGGVAYASPRSDVETRVDLPPSAGRVRLFVLSGAVGGTLTGSANGEALGPGIETGALHIRELGLPAQEAGHGASFLTLTLHDPEGISAIWVVPRAAASEVGVDLRPPDK
jgi:Sulfatase/HEAT repeats